MVRKLIAIAALVPSLALAGCAAGAAAPQAQPEHPLATAASRPATEAPTHGPAPAAQGIVDTVLVDVYPGEVITATHGCGCTVPGGTAEQFPAGSPAILVKIALTGYWDLGQTVDYQNVTGTTVDGTKFDGRPDLAVLDTADGPAAAKNAGLPWLPAGLFAGKRAWHLRNGHPRAFAAVWYLPPGVDRLLLTVDVPSEAFANELTVPLPDAAIRASNPQGPIHIGNE